MRLYHYTSRDALRPIGEFGLTVGDVPTDIVHGKGLVGVWLTSSEQSEGHGLDTGPLEKRAFRLSVDIDDSDPALRKWLDWAPQKATPDTIKALHRAASKSETWFVYFGWIHAQKIVEVIDAATGRPVLDWQQSPKGIVRGVQYRDRFKWQRKMLAGVNKVLGIGQRASSRDVSSF